MARIVRCGLIQARNVLGPEAGLPKIKKAMIERHVRLIAEAARKKVKILCLQELFYGPYFCAEQETRWYELTERVPDGPTVKRMQALARKHKVVLIGLGLRKLNKSVVRLDTPEIRGMVNKVNHLIRVEDIKN